MLRSLIRPRPAEALPLLATLLIVLGAAAPWLFGFSDSHPAVANHIAFAMAFAPLALLLAALRPAAATCLVAGAWLALSPWVLGYASNGPWAWLVDLVLGGGLALAAWRCLERPALTAAAVRAQRQVPPAHPREMSAPAGRRAA